MLLTPILSCLFHTSFLNCIPPTPSQIFHKHLQTIRTKLHSSNLLLQICSFYCFLLSKVAYLSSHITQAKQAPEPQPQPPLAVGAYTFFFLSSSVSFLLVCVSCCNLSLISSLWNAKHGFSALNVFVFPGIKLSLLSSFPTFFPPFSLRQTLVCSDLNLVKHSCLQSSTEIFFNNNKKSGSI